MTSKSITYRKLRKYKYQLKDIYTVNTSMKNMDVGNGFLHLSKEGKLTIQKGYAWDGPSGPTIDTKSFMRASLVHDAFYQLIREKLLNRKEHRKIADQELKKICTEDGMWKIRAAYAYIALRIFGGFAAKPDHTEDKTYTAP